MDQALDDIIASRPRGARRGVGRGPRRSTGRSAKTQVLGTPTVAPATRARAVPATNGAKTVAAAAAQPSSEKIVVSNLPPDVNEAQVKELFHTTVGPVKDVTLNFDSRGVSKGQASVTFQRRGDANKAFQQYNNRLIDGKRPMKIEMVVDPSKAAAAVAPLVSRVAPESAPAAKLAPRQGGRPRRGRGGRREGNERPRKTAEDLDAEMEDYTMGGVEKPAVTA